MQTFYVIIKKESLSLFEQNGGIFEKVYLGGKQEYFYAVNSAQDTANKFLSMIVEEYNLDSVGEIDLIVVNNEDEIISTAMTKAFGKNVKEEISIAKVILTALEKLDRDSKLRIRDYGVNFDEKKYCLVNGEVKKDEFSLLAYTLSDEMVLRYIS